MCVVKRLLMLSHAKRLASRFLFSGLAEKNIVFIYINILSPTLSLLKIAFLPFKIVYFVTLLKLHRFKAKRTIIILI